MRGRGDRVADGEPVGHTEEIECFGLAAVVPIGAEERQRLAMRAQGVLRPPDVGQPVAQPVEAARPQVRIGKVHRKIAGTLVEVARPRVVALGPEGAEIDQRLPFSAAIVAAPGQSERRFEIGPRSLEVADDLVGQSSPPVEFRWNGAGKAGPAEQTWRLRPRDLFGGGDGPTEVFDGGAGGVEAERGLAGAAAVVERLLPLARGEGVVAEIGEVRVECIGVDLLDRCRDRLVVRAPLKHQQTRVDRLPSQRVSEGEAVGRLFDDKLGGEKLPEIVEQLALVAALQDVQQRQVETAAGDGGEGDCLARTGAQPVEPPPHRLFDRARNTQSLGYVPLRSGLAEQDIPAGEERADDLLHEKRVAVGQPVDGIEQDGR